MIKGRNLAAALLLIGSCICGGPCRLYAQGVRTLPYPENITEDISYDEDDETFSLGYKLGDSYLEVPDVLTPDEYNRLMMQRSMRSFYHDKYDEEVKALGDNKFDFTDMKFDLGPAEKIFGPGGVQVRTSGSAAVKFGYNRNKVDNPSLSVQNRTTGGFDFDEQINLNINARVGDKVNMNLNYNTEATFDVDAKMIKMRYEGKEDEIIRLLEAGNISFPTNSSLIQGATSLFGIRSDLQFGKLKLQMVLSQKESTSTSVNSQGGQQITDFEIDASSYDENRHFFLAHFFRDNYDANMAMLPSIVSGVQITRIEVWVTNKRSNYDNPRNIVAFTDLGETQHISNPIWYVQGGPAPANSANNLYSHILSNYPAARDIEQVATSIGTVLEGSTDYEKISNARKLSTSDYTLNSELGYISLKSALSSDEVLAVAFEYTYGGQSYQVGEFSSDNTDAAQALFVKLLKSNSNSPGSGTWDLMMKNIYSINQGSIQRAQFKLGIYYSSDSTGSRITYLPESTLKQFAKIRQYDLIVFQFGQNAVSAKGSNAHYKAYLDNMEKAMNKFKTCFPEASILFVSCGDRGQRTAAGITTINTLENMVALQQQAAANAKVGFYNLFLAMAGKNSMAKLVEQKMANKDYIHINFDGGAHVAQFIYKSFVAGEKKYTRKRKLEEE